MKKPNILFITCHDLGQHIGCYGNDTVHSPALDQLAEQGVLFENSFCTGPTCSPSRASLHTGRYAHSNGVMGLTSRQFGWALNEGELHMAQRLRDIGYHTALLGVQHLSLQPEELGYEYIQPKAPAQSIGKQAADYLSQVAKEAQPFYLEVGFHEPHYPLDYGSAPPDSENGVQLLPNIPEHSDAYDEFAQLQGAIRQLDTGVGMILEALHQHHLDHNTWVIFTTDHGLAIPRAKSTLYDAGIETALLMRYPEAGIIGGKKIPQLISNVDIVPTMLDGMGLLIPKDMQGISFWSLLSGEPYISRNAIFAEKNFHTHYEPMRAVRTEGYKYIINMEVGPKIDVPSDIRNGKLYPLMIKQTTNTRDKVELFDLSKDPLEMNNVANDDSYAVVKKELQQMLVHWMKETDDPILKGPLRSPYYDTVLSMFTEEVN